MMKSNREFVLINNLGEIGLLMYYKVMVTYMTKLARDTPSMSNNRSSIVA